MRSSYFLRLVLVLSSCVLIVPCCFSQPLVPRPFSTIKSSKDRLRIEAEKGDAESQFNLGFLCLYGNQWKRIDSDEKEGMRWVRGSASQGFAQAQDLIGCLLYRGQFLSLDKVAAVGWFHKAAEKGDAYAQSNLGYCYYKGEGVGRDIVEAVLWFRRAAEQGEVNAQRHLGVILESGDGVPRDPLEAAKWFFNLALLAEERDRTPLFLDVPSEADVPGQGGGESASVWIKGAESGDARSQYQLGRCMDGAAGAPAGSEEAINWYRKSALAGFAPAQFIMGYFHQGGIRLNYDNDEVLRWYRKAAGQGYAKAQYNLGCFYGHGQREVGWCHPGKPIVWSTIGIPPDHVEAAKWYRMAAENGHVLAQYVMGRCCYYGEGVPRDMTEAVRWWRKAAEQGHARSQFNLAVMCFHGRGMPEDFVEAAKWFRMRADKPSMVFRCGNGMPPPRPMAGEKSQEVLVPLSEIPDVK